MTEVRITFQRAAPLPRGTNKLSLARAGPPPMLTVNFHETKTHLSRLLDRAAKGEPFIIAKAGEPLVEVVPLETPEAAQVRRVGFMAGQIAVPDDFDRMGGAEIEQLFCSNP